MPEIAPGAAAFLAFIVLQRLLELTLAHRNTERLLARGGREHGAAHYPLIVALHVAWIAALVVFGIGNPISVPWLVVFAVLQILRLWILVNLGSRWTTRIMVLDEPLVARGPYRVLRHPNYLLVVAEIIAAPMVLGIPWIAALFTVLNVGVLAIRIAAENAALTR